MRCRKPRSKLQQKNRPLTLSQSCRNKPISLRKQFNKRRKLRPCESKIKIWSLTTLTLPQDLLWQEVSQRRLRQTMLHLEGLKARNLRKSDTTNSNNHIDDALKSKWYMPCSPDRLETIFVSEFNSHWNNEMFFHCRETKLAYKLCSNP